MGGSWFDGVLGTVTDATLDFEVLELLNGKQHEGAYALVHTAPAKVNKANLVELGRTPKDKPARRRLQTSNQSILSALHRGTPTRPDLTSSPGPDRRMAAGRHHWHAASAKLTHPTKTQHTAGPTVYRMKATHDAARTAKKRIVHHLLDPLSTPSALVTSRAAVHDSPFPHASKRALAQSCGTNTVAQQANHQPSTEAALLVRVHSNHSLTAAVKSTDMPEPWTTSALDTTGHGAHEGDHATQSTATSSIATTASHPVSTIPATTMTSHMDPSIAHARANNITTTTATTTMSIDPSMLGARTRETQLMTQLMDIQQQLQASQAAEAAARDRANAMSEVIRGSSSMRREMNKQLTSARKATSTSDAEVAHLKRRVEALQQFMAHEKAAREEAQARLVEAHQKADVLSTQVEAGRQQIVLLQECVNSTGAAHIQRDKALQQVHDLESQLEERDAELEDVRRDNQLMSIRTNQLEQQVAGLQSALEQLYVTKIGAEQLHMLKQQLAEQQASLILQHATQETPQHATKHAAQHATHRTTADRAMPHTTDLHRSRPHQSHGHGLAPPAFHPPSAPMLSVPTNVFNSAAPAPGAPILRQHYEPIPIPIPIRTSAYTATQHNPPQLAPHYHHPSTHPHCVVGPHGQAAGSGHVMPDGRGTHDMPLPAGIAPTSIQPTAITPNDSGGNSKPHQLNRPVSITLPHSAAPAAAPPTHPPPHVTAFPSLPTSEGIQPALPLPVPFPPPSTNQSTMINTTTPSLQPSSSDGPTQPSTAHTVMLYPELNAASTVSTTTAGTAGTAAGDASLHAKVHPEDSSIPTHPNTQAAPNSSIAHLTAQHTTQAHANSEPIPHTSQAAIPAAPATTVNDTPNITTTCQATATVKALAALPPASLTAGIELHPHQHTLPTPHDNTQHPSSTTIHIHPHHDRHDHHSRGGHFSSLHTKPYMPQASNHASLYTGHHDLYVPSTTTSTITSTNTTQGTLLADAVGMVPGPVPGLTGMVACHHHPHMTQQQQHTQQPAGQDGLQLSAMDAHPAMHAWFGVRHAGVTCVDPGTTSGSEASSGVGLYGPGRGRGQVGMRGGAVGHGEDGLAVRAADMLKQLREDVQRRRSMQVVDCGPAGGNSSNSDGDCRSGPQAQRSSKSRPVSARRSRMQGVMLASASYNSSPVGRGEPHIYDGHADGTRSTSAFASTPRTSRAAKPGVTAATPIAARRNNKAGFLRSPTLMARLGMSRDSVPRQRKSWASPVRTHTGSVSVSSSPMRGSRTQSGRQVTVRTSTSFLMSPPRAAVRSPSENMGSAGSNSVRGGWRSDSSTTGGTPESSGRVRPRERRALQQGRR